MTDRERLIELQTNNCKTEKRCVDSCFECMADHLIANGVTFAKDTNVPSWIPVSERLPEHDLPKGSKVKRIKVLVAYKTNSRWVTRTQIRAKVYWYGEPDRWSWVKTSDPITHWMPLPEPPNGERRTEK